MIEQQKEQLNFLRAQAVSAVGEVMEMSFIDADHLESQNDYEDIDWLNLNALYGTILILYPFPGELRLIIPTSLAVEMAKNIYVIEEDPTEEILNDLIAETINMMAGRFMAAITPAGERFKLGLPELGEESFLQTDTFSLAIDFDAEGVSFWLVIRGEGFIDSV